MYKDFNLDYYLPHLGYQGPTRHVSHLIHGFCYLIVDNRATCYWPPEQREKVAAATGPRWYKFIKSQS
jgi:hypothetical protein